MPFGIGTNSQGTSMGEVRGTQREIACQCWFTSTGKITPLMLKVQNEDGTIQKIDQITIHSQGKKNYAGTPSIEYDCTLEILGRSYRVWLIYFQSEGRWVINYR